MKSYFNTVVINGENFTHEIKADSYSEALKINKNRKKSAALRGRKIVGHLTKG